MDLLSRIAGWLGENEATISAVVGIAVLPFDNLSGDPEQEYFADGFADELITLLSALPAIRASPTREWTCPKDNPDKLLHALHLVGPLRRGTLREVS